MPKPCSPGQHCADAGEAALLNVGLHGGLDALQPNGIQANGRRVSYREGLDHTGIHSGADSICGRMVTQ
jgi:hypothetical protein